MTQKYFIYLLKREMDCEPMGFAVLKIKSEHEELLMLLAILVGSF